MLEVDVAVVGAGFAGLCLARHLVRARPGTTVALLDRGPLPRSPDLRGVGESTSEIAAWYLAERLGLRALLEREQIVKFGLRFWLRGGEAIDERVELGPMGPPLDTRLELIEPLEPHAYQLHRGRIEASLDALLGDAVVRFGDRRVLGVQEHPRGWLLELDGQTIQARWVVDASGDGSLSRQQLGATLHERRLDHRLAAAWWWVEGRVDPASWAARASVRERVPEPLRWRSTHHFVGAGYWVWLIPLCDGSTSVGIVVDRMHAERHGTPLASLPSDPLALGEILREHFVRLEPELASRLDSLASSPVVARQLDSRAFTRPVARGWLVTGAALAFLDPLYSSGHDLLAIVHELAVPAIVADLEGRDPELLLAHANRSFAAIVDHFAGIYVGSGEILAQPILAALAVVWEQAIYFGWLCPLVFGGVLDSAEPALRPLADRVDRLGARMHELLRRWADRRTQGHGELELASFVDQGQLGAVMRQFLALAPLVRESPSTSRVLAQLGLGVARLEALALGLFERACLDLGIAPPTEAIDPYAISLDPRRWAADGLFSPRRARPFDAEVRRDLDSICPRAGEVGR